MVDTLSTAERSERMSRVRGKNTKPELTVRRLVFGLGYRYRLHRKDLPGKPDLVFPGRKAVILVHGCFWHLHDCGKYNIPKTKADFWQAKLSRNVERDAEVLNLLRQRGWRVLTLWECELKDIAGLSMRIVDFLGPPRLG